MSHLDEHPLFSLRYGLIDAAEQPQWADKQPWASRHKMIRADARMTPERWCVCPGGSLSETPCGLAMTQEDFLCDECRAWCVAVDSAGVYHHFASLPQFTQRRMQCATTSA